MHFHWTACFPELRRLIGELGARWHARGLIASAEDVYCLGLDEMPVLARSPRAMHDQLRARREAWTRDQARVWPIEIRQGTEVYASDLDQASTSAPDGLRGIPGSPGVVTGRACVVRGPEDFGRLEPGAVLVAPLTTPVWTPLFAVAGGLVTETGGILSHGAIVAREYGIPAVMGVRGAMTRIADGLPVTVDGSRGTVSGEAVG
jgi:pyruvate,water dikinase